MNNLDIYNAAASVPENAQKKITGGRLNGMTDINPMWRIKVLTEQFGVCGFGWKYVITDKRIIDGANGVKCAFVDIDLFVKVDDKWSDAIQGTGGSSFISAEKSGMYTDDECFKKALTDAISVSCKALGIGADVYWSAGSTKYTQPVNQNRQHTPQNTAPATCSKCKKKISGIKNSDGTLLQPEQVAAFTGGICYKCYMAAQQAAQDSAKTVNINDL